MSAKRVFVVAHQMNSGMDSKEYAGQMAGFVEHWLGNPASRAVLKFAAARCPQCGRRIDLALRDFLGLSPKMCIKCKASSSVINRLLSFLIEKNNISRKDAEIAFADPMWRKGLSSVMEGIAEFGPKKPFTAFVPFLVVWNITRACNLSCKHCYESALVKDSDELNTEEALKAVDGLAEAGVAYLAISGGEPLVRKDLFEIIQRIRKNEMAFSIATNGTLLTRENARQLKSLGCLYAQVSLDGAKPLTHNRFRGSEAFERTIEGIKNAVSEGLLVGIAMTVTQHNYKEVPAALDLAEKLGAGLFMHYNFIPAGRGKEIIGLDISPEKREELLAWLAGQIGKRKIPVLSTAPQFSSACKKIGKPCALTHFDVISQDTKFGDSISFLADFVGGCGAGRLYMAMEPNGDFEPCVFMPIKIGNIRKDSLLETWHKNIALNKMRKREEFWGNCGICENRSACGGCRARAYGYFADVQGPDPGCIKNLEYWKRLKGESKEISLVAGVMPKHLP
ncbi:MAG: radical SAM protein [Candidatus ainarchaeum sp.]|nr:radical SAM protein [Candidatus ainarchaeum sp.]